jgi:outer membrane receptor protein involved in Fe transport
MNFTLGYSVPLGSIGELRTRWTWLHEGTKGTIVADPHYTRVKKHGLLGGRVGLDFKDGVTTIALFGSNLLDREYFVAASDFSASNGTSQRFYAPPRTYGLEIVRKF